MIAIYGKNASAVVPPPTVTVCAGMATHETDEGIALAMKRVSVRQDCPHCGISLGKSSSYEDIVICTHKDDSDSAFEIPSDEDPVSEDHSLPEPTKLYYTDSVIISLLL